MSTATVITISTSLCAAIITALLSVGTVLGGNLKEKIHRWFLATLVFNTAGSCFEAFSVYLNAVPGDGAAALFRAVDFASYACGSLVGVAFSLYLYQYLSLKVEISKTPFVLMALCNGANIALLAAGQFTGVFGLLDESNNYGPQDGAWMAQVLPLISMAILLSVTFRNIPSLKPREWISVLFYAIVPMLCYGIEYQYRAYPMLWISYFGVAAALLLVYINIQVELKHMLSEKDAELAESRIAVMLSQIQPHFLYNSLNAISELCDGNEEAGGALIAFAEYLRGNLDSISRKQPIAFERELEHTRQYLLLEKLRFEERLQVEYDLRADGFAMPALTLQPIVENAVRHGVTKKPEGGFVRIETEETADSFRIAVTDDGVGFDPGASRQGERSHMGIENVRSRLAAICGGLLTVRSIPGKGTSAVIELPKKRGART